MMLFEYLAKICGDSPRSYSIVPKFRYDGVNGEEVIYEYHHYIVDGVLSSCDIKKIFNDFPDIDSIKAKDFMLVIIEKV